MIKNIKFIPAPHIPLSVEQSTAKTEVCPPRPKITFDIICDKCGNSRNSFIEIGDYIIPDKVLKKAMKDLGDTPCENCKK